MIWLAHGLGGDSELPIEVGLAVYAAAFTLLASFAALGLLWPRSRLRADGGRPVPAAAERALDSAAVRWPVRLAVLALAGFITVVAIVGPRDTVANLAPYALYVVFWCGLVAVPLVLGPVWRAVNPLRTVHRLACGAARTDPDEGLQDLPVGLGLWPAAAGLGVFVWLELVPEWRARPVTVGVFLVAYATVHVVAAQVYGERWFAGGDAFEAYSTLVGRLAPIGRRPDSRLVLRNPLDGLDGTPAVPGLTAVVCVLLGSAGFDGITRTTLWTDAVDPGSLIAGTVGLGATIGLVALTYVGAARLSAVIGGSDPALAPTVFAHAVVPIAVGYAVAHYFALLMFEGQQALILASDPFQTGADYLGTVNRGIDQDIVSPTTVGYVQVGAIVLGHLVGVVSAHDRAVRIHPARTAVRSQYPLLVLMVGYTVAGIALLLGS